MHPWRCTSCDKRFLGPDDLVGPKRKWPLVVGLLSVLLLLAIGVASVSMLGRDELPKPDGAAESAAVGELEPADALDAQFRAARAALLDTARGREVSTEAVGKLRQAAEGGHTGAMVLLGKLYRSGIGMPQNYALAARWLGEAANAGDPEGMVEFGRLHRSGIGVEQDAVQAYVWFNRAAALLNMEGVQERDSIAVKLGADELRSAQTLSLEAAEAEAAKVEAAAGQEDGSR
ncbi:Sel1 domain-containing protein repeat-containing protein [Thauera phenylacetica B4P]|uniref:Sel1 domain-containing protein repeat-containing protein n=1 Tax=Thauera phenylacetica B4P TaxID=1234382 RepID=N6ZTM0_9RHOO|nr:Sel1 domain-containing protein repeat-containing protein [Thauera phenylacetica B4P]